MQNFSREGVRSYTGIPTQASILASEALDEAMTFPARTWADPRDLPPKTQQNFMLLQYNAKKQDVFFFLLFQVIVYWPIPGKILWITAQEKRREEEKENKRAVSQIINM